MATCVVKVKKLHSVQLLTPLICSVLSHPSVACRRFVAQVRLKRRKEKHWEQEKKSYLKPAESTADTHGKITRQWKCKRQRNLLAGKPCA